MTKRHFVFLDGMRGVAALAVAALHASQVFLLPVTMQPAHASLAVDFFFCLSGFVIAYAYDERLLGQMTLNDFCQKRLIRLYPLILLGVALGAAVMIGTATIGHQSAKTLAALTVGSLFLLPVGLAFHLFAYPLNNPLWSLFFELSANGGYGVLARRKSSLAVDGLVLFIAAMGVIYIAHAEGTLEFIGFRYKKTFLEGFIRVFYPFMAGVLIYRFGLYRRALAMPAVALAAILALALLQTNLLHSWVYDCVCDIVVFPALIIVGARATHTALEQKIWVWSGKLSYPFYILHLPAIIFSHYVIHRFSPTLAPLAGAVLSIGVALAISYVALVAYDEPVRARLSRGASTKTKLAHA